MPRAVEPSDSAGGQQSGLDGPLLSSSSGGGNHPEPGGFCRDFCTLARDDVRGYCGELRAMLPGGSSGANDAMLSRIGAAVDEHDVAMYTKAGCGYCSRATVLLQQQQDAAGFSLSSAIGTDDETRAALGHALSLASVTFPVVLIRGVYVGGADELTELVDQGQLSALLHATRVPFRSGAVPRSEALQRLEVSSTPISYLCCLPVLTSLDAGAHVDQAPQLCRAPSGGDPWWRPVQLTCYANQIRLVSIVHALLFIAALLLSWLDVPAVAYGLLVVFTVDAGVFIVHGASPFGVLGVPTTWLVWRSRGAAVTSIPYKVVWTVYLVTLLPMLLDCGEGEPAGSCIPPLNTTAQRTALVTFTGNSALLGALRF